MERLFLDSNVFFSAAYKRDALVTRLWRLPGVVLCSSQYAVQEARINLEESVQRQRMAELTSDLHLCDPHERALPRGIVLPEKDAPILLAAIDARSDYLLTGDYRHFGRYFGKKIEGILISSPANYFKLRNR